MWVAILSAVLLSAASPDSLSPQVHNFQLCRDGLEHCDPNQLTDEQRRVVASFASGRNFRECADRTPKCDFLKLTPEQVSTLVKLVEEKKILEAAREEQESQDAARMFRLSGNFLACASGGTDCEENTLTLHKKRPLSGRVTQPDSSPRSHPPSGAPDGAVSATAPGASRAARFGRGLLNFLAAAAETYVEMEMAAPPRDTVIVSGGTSVIATGRGVILPTGNSFIESRIDGDFYGWSGETVFKLQNGSLWQQASYAYRYHYAYSPKVKIYRSGSKFMMNVEGVNEAIQVRPLHPM